MCNKLDIKNKSEPKVVEELISIVVPVYNAATFLEKTLQSIKEQTYSNWELFLIDDASSDSSRIILKNWLNRMGSETDLLGNKKHIELFFNSRTCGPAAARNLGVQAAKGRYLVYLDADDYWEKEKLEKQYRFMKQKDCAFSFTSYEFADKNGIRTGKVVHVPESISYQKALMNTTISTITVMLDRLKIPEEFLFMPEDCKREDTATWWRILRQGYLAYGLDKVLSIYCRHKNSHSSNKIKAMIGTYQMYRKQEQFSFGKTIGFLAVNLFHAVKRRL